MKKNESTEQINHISWAMIYITWFVAKFDLLAQHDKL